VRLEDMLASWDGDDFVAVIKASQGDDTASNSAAEDLGRACKVDSDRLPTGSQCRPCCRQGELVPGSAFQAGRGTHCRALRKQHVVPRRRRFPGAPRRTLRAGCCESELLHDCALSDCQRATSACLPAEDCMTEVGSSAWHLVGHKLLYHSMSAGRNCGLLSCNLLSCKLHAINLFLLYMASLTCSCG